MNISKLSSTLVNLKYETFSFLPFFKAWSEHLASLIVIMYVKVKDISGEKRVYWLTRKTECNLDELEREDIYREREGKGNLCVTSLHCTFGSFAMI